MEGAARGSYNRAENNWLKVIYSKWAVDFFKYSHWLGKHRKMLIVVLWLVKDGLQLFCLDPLAACPREEANLTYSQCCTKEREETC